jgi:hypothetical protein
MVLLARRPGDARPLHRPRNEASGFHRADPAYLQGEEESPDENGVGPKRQGIVPACRHLRGAARHHPGCERRGHDLEADLRAGRAAAERCRPAAAATYGGKHRRQTTSASVPAAVADGVGMVSVPGRSAPCRIPPPWPSIGRLYRHSAIYSIRMSKYLESYKY